MSATMGLPSAGTLTRARGHLRAEFGFGTANEIAELFRSLAVECIQTQANRVLIVAGDDDPANERSLRDALTTMVLAGAPRDLRLGVLATTASVAAAYRNIERDATAVGLATRVFDNEEDALAWLGL